MIKSFLIGALLLAGCLLVLTTAAQAAPRISANNPYRSFNISGINYGSMNWERTHNPSNYNPRGRTGRHR